MTDLPDIKLKALVSFPAAVHGGAGVRITYTNGIYTISLDPTYTGIYTPGGVGAVTRPVGNKLDDIVSSSDYTLHSQAVTAAESAGSPHLTAPTTDGFTSGDSYAPVAGAKTRKGFITGHVAITDNTLNDTHAFVSMRVDETYGNTAQEVRGVHSLVRNYRTVADEATLGWDFFGVMGSVSVEAANTQFIRGNQKAVVGELYFFAPLSGTYTVKLAHGFQASSPAVGANVTVTQWYGMIINAPTGLGVITEGYGIRIEALALPTTTAAIKLDGTGNNGRILWNTAYLSETAGGSLQAVGNVLLGGLSGVQSMLVNQVASSVNYWDVFGATATNRLILRASGTDSNVGTEYQTKGSGTHLFRTNLTEPQFEIQRVASTVNWLRANGGATGNSVVLSATGGDTNVDISVTPRGIGSVIVTTGKIRTAATTTSYASLNLPAGTAPSAPVDGDIWREDNTNTGLKVRINGVTKTITVA